MDLSNIYSADCYLVYYTFFFSKYSSGGAISPVSFTYLIGVSITLQTILFPVKRHRNLWIYSKLKSTRAGQVSTAQAILSPAPSGKPLVPHAHDPQQACPTKLIVCYSSEPCLFWAFPFITLKVCAIGIWFIVFLLKSAGSLTVGPVVPKVVSP